MKHIETAPDEYNKQTHTIYHQPSQAQTCMNDFKTCSSKFLFLLKTSLKSISVRNL